MKISATLPFVLFSALALCSCGASADSKEEIKYATVTLSANGGAFLDTEITKTLQVEIGKTFNFDERPAKEGYKFSYWSESVTSKTVYEIGKEIVNGDLNLFAQYEAQQYFLTAQSANETFGTVSGSGLYYAGTVVSVHAFPEDGFALEGWYINEKLVSTTLDYKFEMPSEKTTIEAKFIPEGFDMLRRLG
ncbi:MAG: InlB B-repeat-containing protein, partial [Bacilli bacterium]|nr:InlB B-repeat-containing protein [Bacilli bacterium]